MSQTKQQPSQQQTLQQRRAASAWRDVTEVERANDKKKEYGSLVKGLAAQIQRDGLGPTLAFLRAKAKLDQPPNAKKEDKSSKEHLYAYEHISRWVLGELKQDSQQTHLLAYLISTKCSSDDYRRAAVEAQAYLVWLKRFAEAKDLGDTSSSRE